MIVKSKIIISFALLCMFLLTGSASAAVDFPADEAGISAYVKASSSIDLNDAKSAFASIERETSDYIIGTVALTYHSEEEYPHVYVSTDGWIVAYYPKERERSWIIPWGDYAGAELSSTTLSKAVGTVATAVGGTPNGLKYYDFGYTDATKMMMIIESVSSDTNYFYVNTPTTFSTYAVDWSHFASTVYSGGGYGYSKTYLDEGTSFSNLPVGTQWAYGSLLGQFDNGIDHKIQITTDRGTGRIGLVLEYAE